MKWSIKIRANVAIWGILFNLTRGVSFIIIIAQFTFALADAPDTTRTSIVDHCRRVLSVIGWSSTDEVAIDLRKYIVSTGGTESYLVPTSTAEFYQDIAAIPREKVDDILRRNMFYVRKDFKHFNNKPMQILNDFDDIFGQLPTDYMVYWPLVRFRYSGSLE